MSVVWTPEADAVVRREIMAGASRSKVAEMLTDAGFAVSKNAVIGRAYRLGIQGPVREAPPKAAMEPERFRWSAEETATLRDLMATKPKRLAIAEMTRVFGREYPHQEAAKKIKKLGLTFQQMVIKPAPAVEQIKSEPVEEIFLTRRIDYFKHTDQCRMVCDEIGDDGMHMLCAEPRVRGSYCREHAKGKFTVEAKR